MKKSVVWAIDLIVFAVIAAGLYYFSCPAFNLKSKGFWFFVGTLLFILAVLLSATLGGFDIFKVKRNRVEMKLSKFGRKLFLVVGILILAEILLAVISSRFFHARAYSQILTVSEGSTADIPSVEGADAIALMDTASARKLGDREIGSLNEVVSQYELGYDYTQLNIDNRPVKVAPLSYAGFFKWVNNRDAGIPGYVSVDPVSMDASYTKLDQGMTYVPSGYFGDNLYRHIRFAYPTALFYDPHFEVDEEGNPWYVAPVYTYSIAVFGGEKVVGAILVNPVSGETYRYALADVPTWVDVVIPGDLICEQYNNYAQLQNGYWNSVIGQNGCRKVTESSEEEGSSDYGYIAMNDDIFIYTGVTSVNGDSSNIGFIIANERTGETRFIACSGADEFSAMSAAEGEVQEKGYWASFPSLITVDDTPTYIMVLKDKSGLVKMYACVNVQQYNMVVTSTSQADCIEKYRALLSGRITAEQANDDSLVMENPSDTDLSAYEEKTVKVVRMETIDRNGNTWLYIVDENSNIYSAQYVDVIDMLLVEPGDTITILEKDGAFRYPAN